MNNHIVSVLNEYLENYKDSMNLYSYVRFYAPDVIADIQGAFSFLTSELSDTNKVSIIIECHRVKQDLFFNRTHKGGAEFSDQDILQMLRDNLLPLGIRIADRQLINIYFSVCGIMFDKETLSCNDKSRYAVNNLLLTNQPKDNAFQILVDLRITGSSDYVANELACSQADYFDKKQHLDEVLYLLKRNREYWRDAICALYYEAEYNDIELENKYVYYEYTRCLRKQENPSAIVVDPSPFFIRKWIGDSALNGIKTDFIISDISILQLLTSVYPQEENINFIAIDAFDNCTNPEPASAILIFGNHITNDEVKSKLLFKLNDASKSSYNIYILDSDKVLFSNESLTHEALGNVAIDRIDLLPAGITGSTIPKRKTLLRGRFGYVSIDDANNFRIIRHKLERNHKVQYLSASVSIASATQASFMKCSTSYRALFEKTVKEDTAKTNKKRNVASEYKYSDEISIFYTIFDLKEHIGRVRAYTVLVNGLTGERIAVKETTCERRNVDIRRINKWIEEEYLYTSIRLKNGEIKDIRAIISNKITPLFDHANISLKGFIYGHPEIEEELSDIRIKDLRNMAKSEIGSLKLKVITSQLLQDYIEDAYSHNKLNSNLTSFTILLRRIFNIAIEHNNCRFNPAESLFINNKERYDELDEVTNALGKHFLTLKEIGTIIEQCNKHIEKGHIEFIAVLLRLYTGLEANIICALQWQDLLSFTTSDGEILYQLRIERQVSKTGKQLEPFKRKEQVRSFPLANPIAEILLNLKDKIKANNIGISDDIFSHKSIIEGKTPINLSTRIVQPSKVNQLCRQFLNSLDIPEDYLPLPDNQYGILDTDLNACRGDIFKNSFRHYLLRVANPTQGEINYLLGIQAPNVDYGNYIDCGSERKQSEIYEFLQKLWNLYNGEN